MDTLTSDWTISQAGARDMRDVRIRALEDENARLRRLLVDALLAKPAQSGGEAPEGWGRSEPQPDIGDALLLCDI